MSVFFNGRELVSPTVQSAINDSALYNTGIAVPNTLAIIGQSTGGEPNTALAFGSPTEAAAAFRSGDLVDAINRAFNPSSDTGSPQTVIGIRVNPAVQSALTLKDGSANAVINLTSTDYGAYTNQIKVKVEAASTTGLKLTTQLGTSYYTQDNVYRNAFSIQYTGVNASASMTISGTNLTLASPTGTTVGSADFASYPTIQTLVDYINSIPGFVATVLDNNGLKSTANALDYVNAQNVKTALYTATANLQAAVDWFNSQSEGFVTATRTANGGAAPALIPFTYLSGGSDGVVTNTEWSNAFTTLQAEDAQWVVALSGDQSIAAMLDAHVVYMASIGYERRAIAATVSGTTDTVAISDAKALNSDRTSLVHLGIYDYDANGNLVLFQPYILAAMIGGMFAGSNPATPMTNKSIKVQGLERRLRVPTDTDPLIQGGVLCVADYGTRGFRVVKSISTWLNDTRYDKVEQSVGDGYDFVARAVRTALQPLVGQKAGPLLLGRAKNITESTLRNLAIPDPTGPGVLVGDAKNPPYKNITVSLSGDALYVQFEASVALPANYVLVTINAQVYSGSVSA